MLAGSKLVADRFEAKFHYTIWFEACRRPASNLSATSFESASVMEFGFNKIMKYLHVSSCRNLRIHLVELLAVGARFEVLYDIMFQQHIT